ncbi:response regulator transcription factor [Clostridium beijerinckii]|uniref:Stage 0 sporulation protein A homolog n=1 Tax=Clostridium beijerinckii TaxID=1520 RepID=A0A7X9SKQ7_CLOBE|nr:response regulator transcription factor [Clostridium beijerinckii]NMF03697.1 response regulator transcription factor [Clostridium beijerinckii]
MKKILIVEDNKDLNTLLSKIIKEAGYLTKSLYDGLDVIKELKENKYDMIILDIMLPYKSGDMILKEIRKDCDVPVIIVSAKDLTGTKVYMLKNGADDYITKPFNIDEVIARIETNLRRYENSKTVNEMLYYKDIKLDTRLKRVIVHKNEVNLTVKEYNILELLMKNQDRVYSKANLYEIIWESEFLGDDKTIKTHMSRLRNKLKEANKDEEYIETVWGIGYRLIK